MTNRLLVRRESMQCWDLNPSVWWQRYQDLLEVQSCSGHTSCVQLVLGWAPFRLTYPGPAVRCNLLKGRLLELLHHLSPPFPLLLLNSHAVHCGREPGQHAGPAR